MVQGTDIGVVIVTYADRRKLLQQVILSLLNQTLIEKILVVGNKTTYTLNEFVNDFGDARIIHLSLDINTGSAAGYKAGMQYFMNDKTIEKIWLLDDDNLPDDSSLSKLNDAIIQSPNGIFIPLREDREYLKRASQGSSLKFLFPQPNSFLGFHLFIFIRKKMSRILLKKKKSIDNIQIPMAPYGGLFFNKNILDIQDLPNEQLYLYGDDFIFTYALFKKGIHIKMMSDIHIYDIDESWINKVKSPGIKYLFQHDFRSWFSARNAAYFSKYFLLKSKLMFWVNKNIYMLSLFTFSILYNKRREFKRFHEMVEDGLNKNFDNDKILNWKNDEDAQKNL